MRHNPLKTSFLTFSLLALASLTGLSLSSCSQDSQKNSTVSSQQNSAKNSPASAPVVAQKAEQNNAHNMEMMNLGPADDNYDLRFIDAMIPHHQGAVEMANQLQKNSTRPEMKKLAADIITAQEKEIQQMQQWRKQWYPQANSQAMMHDNHTGHTMPMSDDIHNKMMMQMNLGAADSEFDLRFINAMIPHHEGALIMAQDVLNKSKRPEMRQLADEIISSQKAEIDQMKQWRQTWYKQ
ncbi:DUF305 domain-containing protein [Ancylothrix sp. C2]|uniref:DUF305 domain-containing protein n=1 Tax=Ancylothrix sp. D3o TaxID=2953691 RepID=UPI0021BA974F|nr:DUF305 domain-containing protein [Ancylothrix sp. D3o]MCT7951983.1 DUF305 domain-containing protein [Ancylothrix sp. D3o]